MKTLLIMRHAKSSWKEPGASDHSRPLNGRGRLAAPRMGRWLHEQRLVPDRILCSDARRAVETAEAVAQHCHFPADVQLHGELYLAGPRRYVEVLKKLDDSVQRAMVIGHNPGLEELVRALTRHRESMPTGAVAHVELPVDHWNQLDTHTHGRLLDFWRPKELPEEENVD